MTFSQKYKIFLLFIFAFLSGNVFSAPILKKINHIKLKNVEYLSKDSMSFTMPFSLAGNLIILKARVDTIEGNFILDTGCPELVLNLTYFRDYPRSIDADDDTKGITGNVGVIEHTSIKELEFGKRKEFDIKADLVNLGHIENRRGVKVLGLIGMKFIDDCEMIVDYEKHLIYFHVIAKKESKTYQSIQLQNKESYSTIPFDIISNRIIVTSEIANKKVKLIIDCAAETNILSSKLPNNVFDIFTVTGTVNLTGASSKKVEALKGEIQSFIIGNKELKSLPFIVVNLDKTCFSVNGCVDGVLGFDFLGLQKIGFNFVKQQMYLWK